MVKRTAVRAVLGAVAGGVAGTGVYLTWLPWMLEKCTEADLDGPGCGPAVVMALPWFLAFWTVVAGLLLFGVYKLLRRPGSAAATGLGCALWVPLWVAAGFIGLFGEHDPKEILVPIAGFALAAAVTGRSGGTAPADSAVEDSCEAA